MGSFGLIVYGIEGKNFSAGVGLSKEVENAAAAVVSQVLNEARALLASGSVG
jgi:Ni,Fe-hydrogenase maturation factor